MSVWLSGNLPLHLPRKQPRPLKIQSNPVKWEITVQQALTSMQVIIGNSCPINEFFKERSKNRL